MPKITKISEFQQDDWNGIRNGEENQTPTPFYKLKQTSATSYEISEFGPCMNPDGYVSNLTCPDSDPLCNCPNKHLQPDRAEPTENELVELRNKTNECFLIKRNLSTRWFGLDYSNPHSSYNCYAGLSGTCGPVGGSASISPFSFTSKTEGDERFPYDTRKGYTHTEGDITRYSYRYNMNGISGGICGGVYAAKEEINNFSDYLAYSKTNATFWNTPEKTPLLRKAQTNLLTYQRVKILVNGNFEIKPGNTVGLNIRTGYGSSQPEFTRFDGKWMIYKIERIMTVQKHSMYLYLMRDSSKTDPSIAWEITKEKPQDV